MTPLHPIEIQSYRILRDRVPLEHLPPVERAVVERIIHASADIEYARTVVIQDGAAEAAVVALRRGGAVIADVEMVRVGITGVSARCYLADAHADEALTRSATAMRLAAERHPDGAVVVVGCAPTALVQAVELAQIGTFRPAAIIGLPVGFVGASESKELARSGPIPSITNVGEKGGSSVAVAAVNALVRFLQLSKGGDDHG